LLQYTQILFSYIIIIITQKISYANTPMPILNLVSYELLLFRLFKTTVAEHTSLLLSAADVDVVDVM